MKNTLKQLLDFFDIQNENGVSNLEKVHKYQKNLRRVEMTDKSKSEEVIENNAEIEDIPNGIVTENGKIIGLGIHIYNEDVYPLYRH